MAMKSYPDQQNFVYCGVPPRDCATVYCGVPPRDCATPLQLI